jgi:hypothetical protein
VHNERKYVEPVWPRSARTTTTCWSSTTAAPTAPRRCWPTSPRPGTSPDPPPGQPGYGQSLIDAFAFADRQGYDWVVTMDCDEQHEPERIPRFVELIASDRST